MLLSTMVYQDSLGPNIGEVETREAFSAGKWLDWPGENVNLVNYTAYASVVEDLHAKLLDYIQLPKVHS